MHKEKFCKFSLSLRKKYPHEKTNLVCSLWVYLEYFFWDCRNGLWMSNCTHSHYLKFDTVVQKAAKSPRQIKLALRHELSVNYPNVVWIYLQHRCIVDFVLFKAYNNRRFL